MASSEVFFRSVKNAVSFWLQWKEGSGNWSRRIGELTSHRMHRDFLC
jgi:hypothetical protein